MRIPDHGCCHRCGHSCVGGVVEAGHAAKEAEHAAASRLLVEAQATRRGSGRHSKSSFLHCMEVRWQKLTSLVESSMRRPSASSSLTLFFPEYLHTMHTRHASRRLLRHPQVAGTTNAARTADVDSIARHQRWRRPQEENCELEQMWLRTYYDVSLIFIGLY